MPGSPRRLVEQSPRLSLTLQAAGNFFSQDHPQRVLEAAQRFARRGSKNAVSDRVFAGLAEILAMRSVRDYRGALPVVDRDREFVDARRGEWLEVPGEVRAIALLQWGITRMLVEDVRGAVRDFQEAYWAGARSEMTHFARNGAEFAAVLLALVDSGEQAQEWLSRARSLPPVEEGLRSFVEDWEPLGEAVLALGRLDLPAAREALERFRPAPETHLAWSVLAWVRARLALLEGKANVALELVAHESHPRGGGPDPDSFDEALLAAAEAELALATGRVARAESVLMDLRESPFLGPARARLALMRGELEEAVFRALAGMHQEVPFGRVDLKVVGAAALRRLGRQAEAAETFGHELELSRVLGVIAPFAMLPREELEALVALVPRAEVELSRVLAALPVENVDKVPVVELSLREKLVLAELARTSSAREIATRLYVSANTVKSQLRSIYRKLGVHSREAALEVAHELGFDLSAR